LRRTPPFAIPGVRATETFTYLHLEKQTYSWGTG
jgi:hypothetical protein